MHSSPHQDPPKLRARAGPALLALRPRSTSVPPTPTTVARMAKRYMPVTEEVTPPMSPARVIETDPATPSPVHHPGKGRGRCKWRAQSSETPGVETRSRTKQAETAATQTQTSRASWPEKPDKSLQISLMARYLQIRDPPEDRFMDIQRTLPTYKIDENQNEIPASSGWNPQSSSGCLLHPTPARRWWRRGGIDPSEHVSSGVDSPC